MRAASKRSRRTRTTTSGANPEVPGQPIEEEEDEVRILDAMTGMQAVLVNADAPRRQMDGVAAWRADIVDAVAAAHLWPNAEGMRIDDTPRLGFRGGWSHPPQVAFLRGDTTHRAWLQLSRAIASALWDQWSHASLISEAAWVKARKAEKAYVAMPSLHAHRVLIVAVRRAKLADTWRLNAALATSTGRALIRREDRILRPVGEAIASVGGITQVARDKHYHQAGSTR